ncbi:MAG: T9SS type A sorting domain-containing protein [Saprospiraceae bacterium]|nr:T9SS type A sorting domain-containing protein [Saprospiraceae bacterium]
MILASPVTAQNSCPDPDTYGIQCVGLCGTSGSSCSYTETFQTDFTGSGGKYVRVQVFANNVQVYSNCLGPFDGKVTKNYSVNFMAPCDASIYTLYSAYTNSSSQNPCAGATCADGFCAYDTCQQGIYLPITLESFVARQSDRVIDLTWTTLTETDNDYFELEKSFDGMDWQLLTTKRGSGNDGGKTVYSITDKNPYAGENYYRLTQVDVDGTRHYQGMVIVKNYSEFINYRPEYRGIQYSSQANSDLNVNVIDMRGQLVDQILLSPGDMKILPANMPSGIYLLHYYNGESANTIKAFIGD